jgi:serine/threonine protein kinase
MVMGSPPQPTRRGRVFLDGERCYLIMPLARFPRTRKDLVKAETTVITLADLLLASSNGQWPSWFPYEGMLGWGIQLCRIVARLHRVGVVLGDLDARTIVVNSADASSCVPALLPSWPPVAPYVFSTLQASSDGSAIPPHDFAEYKKKFPIAIDPIQSAFAAPEMAHGSYDERSDVYSLGAILYLLYTHYAPVAAHYRLYAELANSKRIEGDDDLLSNIFEESIEYLELTPPHCLCDLPATLEHIILRALALNPDERYPSAFALVEALEALEQAERTSMSMRKKSLIASMIASIKSYSQHVWRKLQGYFKHDS